MAKRITLAQKEKNAKRYIEGVRRRRAKGSKEKVPTLSEAMRMVERGVVKRRVARGEGAFPKRKTKARRSGRR